MFHRTPGIYPIPPFTPARLKLVTVAAYLCGLSGAPRTRSTKPREIRSERAMAAGFMPARCDALMRFALPVGTSAVSVFVGDTARGGRALATFWAGSVERRRVISAATSRCSVSSSTSSKPRSVAERFLGSVTLGSARGSSTDVEPADAVFGGRGVTSVDFGDAIAATVAHLGDRGNGRQGTCV